MFFRPEAMKKLASAEDLTEAIHVTSPMAWVLVSVLCFGLGVALMWGLAGTIYTRVSGPAFIVYKNADATEVIAMGSGTLVKLNVEQGDKVSAGEVLGYVANPGLISRLEQAMRVSNEARVTISEYETAKLTELKEFERLQALQRKALEGRLIQSKRMAESYEARLDGNEDLLNQGFTVHATVDNLRSLYFQAQQNIETVRYEIAQLAIDLEDRKTIWNNRILDLTTRHSELLANVRELEQQLEQAKTIRSPVDGEISPILVTQGTHLAEGETVFTIVQPNAHLDTLGFLSASDSKLVETGMKVQISPSTIKMEEFGKIVGTVVETSRFPMSSDALDAVLHNRDLVSTFLGSGAPILVRIDMDRSFDGDLIWTTHKTPPFELSAGTLANVSVIVREQAPISLALPILKNWAGWQ